MAKRKPGRPAGKPQPKGPPPRAAKTAKAEKPPEAEKAGPAPRKTGPDIKVARSLSGLGEEVITVAGKGKNPSIAIPMRALSNVRFNKSTSIIEMGKAKQKRSFFNVTMAKRFMQTFLVARGCKELIDQGKTTSIRDLYYHLKHTLGRTSENTFDEQDESDALIEDLEVTVDALREELHLYAENKGAMVGNITIADRGDVIDCRRMGTGGYSIPSIVEEDVVQFRKNDAKFVLLIEKGAVWRRFNEDRFWAKHRCIIVHGGGQPPRGVRRLLYRFANELGLPVYVLVDNDPWGYYIYSVVKQGSINLAYESRRMAVPGAKFVGMSSFDAEKFQLPREVTIKLNDQDKGRANELLKYPWFQQKEWQREIRNMLAAGVKLELEAFSNRDFSFITETYLPRKLADKDWLG
ncbi:MAG TPA: DNA topoisomerase IV subunit A [Planctomycetota bacterium]|nr:DNA topoisomerase IV subunit A [Planctomycetota bacterium]